MKGGSKGTSMYDWFTDIQLVKNVSKAKAENPFPCPVPVELMERLIIILTDKADVVYDPFLGSGTTMVACKRLGRRYIGSETNLDYCRLAQRRVAGAEIIDLDSG